MVRHVAPRSSSQTHDRVLIMAAGEWFCSEACTSISAGLQAALEAGEVDVGAGSSWQLLHGLKGRPDDGDALETARTILQTSFDPIIDRVSGKDLLEAMVFAREVGDWDFHGMHTAILYHEVCSSSLWVGQLQAADTIWRIPPTMCSALAPRGLHLAPCCSHCSL